MKPGPTLVTAASLAILSATVDAGSIGINFSAGTRNVQSTDNPGIVAGANWNNIAGASGTDITLQDDAASPTTATLTFTAGVEWPNFNTPVTANTGTNTMYTGGIGGTNASTDAEVTISSIPYQLYDVYVFGSADANNTSELSVTDGITTYYYASAGLNNSVATTLLQTTSTTPGSATTGGAQYQVFSGLTSSTLTLTQGGSIGGVLSNNLYGIHIVETPVQAGQPILSAPVVNNITTTGAQAELALSNTDADVTLFWDTVDQGTGTWTNSNPLGPQTIGPVAGQITGLSPDTRYFYRFQAVNTAPDPDVEAWSEAGTSFATALTGKPVQGLTAFVFSAFEIDLEWTDDFNTETGFIIQRALDENGPWVTVGTAPADAEFYTDAGSALVADTTYYYRVLATNDAGNSDPSDVVMQATDPAIPLTPQVLVNFDGTLDGTTYTLASGEIDTTGSFKANGSPSLTNGTAVINPDNGGGSDGFNFDPSSLGELLRQNWVAETVISFESFDGFLATIIDVQGDPSLRINSGGDLLQSTYFNGSTAGSQTTDLPSLAEPVHLALAWDAASQSLTAYVDGTSIGPISQGPFTIPYATSVAFGYFGRVGFENRGVDGVLSAVAFSTGTAQINPGTDFVLLPVGATYGTWIDGFDLPTADQGFDRDPDGDNLDNGMEAFFGTNPSEWSAGLTQVSSDGTTTTFTHPQAEPALTDLTAFYQWSVDLVTWYAGDGVDGPGNGLTVTIPAVSPVAGIATVTATASEALPQLFVRVAATN
jgi:hypothetical protein